jgi:S-formylglutathione hydrolase
MNVKGWFSLLPFLLGGSAYVLAQPAGTQPPTAQALSAAGWIDVTAPIDPHLTPVYPGNPPLKLDFVASLDKGAQVTLSAFSFGAHTGTHVDAPMHFIPGGASLDQIPLERFIGPVRIIDCSPEAQAIDAAELDKHDWRGARRVFFRTRNSRNGWMTDPRFHQDFTYLAPDAAQLLADAGVELVGIDYLSIERFGFAQPQTHRILLGKGIPVVEGLALQNVQPGDYELMLLPMRVMGHEAGPARALLRPSGAPPRTPLAADNVHTPPPASAGKYERITVHGESLVGNLEGDSPDRLVSVYLPPSYAQQPKRRYPVLYLLHGFTDSDAHWFGLNGKHFVNVQGAVDRAYAKGARELIVVMPNAFTKYAGSMYSSSPTTGDWEAFVTKDLVSYIDRHYRTLAKPESRGLAGHSMGGYGTLRIAMQHPGVFSSLYAMSPCCLAANIEPDARTMQQAERTISAEQIAAADFGTKAMLASAAAWSPNPRNPPRFFDLPMVGGKPVPQVIAEWAANAPLAMVDQYLPNLKTYRAIAFDAGDRDVGIANTIRTLDGILTGYALAHTFEIYPGDHVSAIDERLETHVLPFFSEHLQYK